MEEDNSTSNDSFLNQLKSKLNKGLKPTTTKTTFPDGSVQYSSCQGSLCESPDKEKTKGYGFVVDTKPDLTVGKIRPWLYVSSQDVPIDAGLLKQFGISHILSLLPGFILPKECSDIIEKHYIVDMYDEESFELDKSFCENIFDFIDEGRKRQNEGRAVLVHCNAGISRAPTVVLAYLMTRDKLPFNDALDQIKKARPSVRPNAGFLKQLEKLSFKT